MAATAPSALGAIRSAASALMPKPRISAWIAAPRSRARSHSSSTEHRRALAQHQPGAVARERPAQIGAEHAQRLPGLHEAGRDRGVAAAGQSEVEHAGADHVERQPDGVRRRSAGRGGGEARAAQAEFHGDQAGRPARHAARQGQRGQAVDALAVEAAVGGLERALADARPRAPRRRARGARPARSAPLHRLPRGDQGELGGAVELGEAARLEMGLRLEAGDLGGGAGRRAGRSGYWRSGGCRRRRRRVPTTRRPHPARSPRWRRGR